MKDCKKEPFYKNGISFKCTNCGRCCSGFPGYVWLSKKDIKNISSFLKIKKDSFLKKHTRRIGPFISLQELKAPSYDCIFLKDNRCSIYKVRPTQCKTYPFWPEHLKTKENFEKYVKPICKGVTKGDLYAFLEIQKILKIHEKEVVSP